MMSNITTRASIRILVNRNVSLVPVKALEASLDCATCKRIDRTIHFKLAGTAVCRDTGHPFNGKLIDVVESICQVDNCYDLPQDARCLCVEYTFNHSYSAFKDKKSGIPSSPKITWGRARYSLSCPKCESATPTFTQPNMSRPVKIHCTKCNNILGMDAIVQPTFKILSRGGTQQSISRKEKQ